MFENPRRGRQARNFTTNVPKIADRKSSSEQIFSENCRWVPLTTIGFPAKGCLRNERKNSIFMTCHYPDLSVSDWLKQFPMLYDQSEALIRVVTRHQYGISALVPSR